MSKTGYDKVPWSFLLLREPAIALSQVLIQMASVASWGCSAPACSVTDIIIPL